MRIISYNVNGIRAALNKGLLNWLKAANPDVVCFQEIKAMHEQIPVALFEELGYTCHWFSAQKKGYSGVGILTKLRFKNIEKGCGMPIYDDEGRIIRIDFEEFSILNVYMPSGSSGEERQEFKMQFLSDFNKYIAKLKKKIPNLVICGDYNICHKAIDIHNPISNANSSGFLPEERDWMEGFINSGFIDTFRHFNTDPHHYSWWSYRANSRAKNLGWRIDYHLVATTLKDRLKHATILPEAPFSDHCPVVLDFH